jgi:cytochrome b6-f complex iron-sulfur subunit
MNPDPTPAGSNPAENSEQKISRRKWMDLALIAGGGLWVAALATPTAFYLWPGRSAGPLSNDLDAGALADFPEGTARMVHAQGGRPILVIRLSGAEFKAFTAVCTHLGCLVEWDPERKVIACPCHAGVYAPEDGRVISGPPPRPLKEYLAMVIADRVKVRVG